MRKLHILLRRFLINEDAATAVEYAMIVGLIALVSFLAFQRLGSQVYRIIRLMVMKMVMYITGSYNPD